MENRSYAFFLPEQNTEKRKNMQILLSLSGINTPILQGESISGKADKLYPRSENVVFEIWFFSELVEENRGEML